MPRVDFERLSPDQYEDMVSVLLSRLRQTRRVDGTGGDEGRDCYFPGEDGTDAYELKSFTGRMTPARRRQVKRSLDRAMESRPRTWTLVVPIDPAPAEQRWFDSLGAGLPAQLEWLGKTWLEEQLARFPDIVRYFSGAADEVVRILTEISREDALPDDAAGLAQQFYVLHRPDIARCWVEPQGRHRASIGVAHPPCLAARASVWSVWP